MYINYVNANGAGFMNKIHVEPGTTVEQFLRDNITNFTATNFDIALNGLPTSGDVVLTEGDRLCAAFRGQKGA